MDLKTLRQAARVKLVETKQEASGPRIDLLLNEALEAFALQAMCNKVESLSMDAVAGQAVYPYPSVSSVPVIQIDDATWGNSTKLWITDKRGDLFTGWQDETGTPTRLLTLTANSFRLYPHPATGETGLTGILKLDGILAGNVLTLDADVPNIPFQYHRALVSYAIGDMESFNNAVERAKMEANRGFNNQPRFVEPYL